MRLKYLIFWGIKLCTSKVFQLRNRGNVVLWITLFSVKHNTISFNFWHLSTKYILSMNQGSSKSSLLESSIYVIYYIDLKILGEYQSSWVEWWRSRHGVTGVSSILDAYNAFWWTVAKPDIMWKWYILFKEKGGSSSLHSNSPAGTQNNYFLLISALVIHYDYYGQNFYSEPLCLTSFWLQNPLKDPLVWLPFGSKAILEMAKSLTVNYAYEEGIGFREK